MANAIIEDLARIRRELTRLGRLRIKVGVQGKSGKNSDGADVAADGGLLMIANVHEYGATITAKKAKNLAIPLKRELRDKSPREIPNTWILETDDGDVFIVRDKGKDEIEFLYMLLPSVHIPERSFIRGSYDSGKSVIDEAADKAVAHVIKDKWTADQAAEWLGAQALEMTIEYFLTKLTPPKSNLTKASTTQEETLRQSGRLFNSITYVIEEEG